MTTVATKPATAEELYAEGMSLLDSGDTLGASETLWAAAATAMEAYAEMRGWAPEPRRMYLDIVQFRREELGVDQSDVHTPNPVAGPFFGASMLEANVLELDRLLTEDGIRLRAEKVRDLLDVFSIDC